MMKKLIAVLLVVFACFSLSADDIPMDWYIQIVKALSDFSSSDFEEWKIEKIDEKTLKLSRNTPETRENVWNPAYGDMEKVSEYIDEYYFRFNLTPEEEKQDRILFMEKGAELFSEGGEIDTYLDKVFQSGYDNIYFKLLTNVDNSKVYGDYFTYLNMYVPIEKSSLTHYFNYDYHYLLFYYK